MQDHLRNTGFDALTNATPVAAKKVEGQNGNLKLNEAYLTRMQAAVLNPDKVHLDDIILEMRSAYIKPTDIADHYIPTVARRLGNCWVEDTLDFCSVSIGSARLQSLLWQMEAIWLDKNNEVCTAQTDMLVIIPQGCQHTLGASVLTGQLRRRGLCVQLESGVTRSMLIDLLRTKTFAAVMISASSREPLETLASLVQTARGTCPDTPVLVGGNVLEQTEDIGKSTGADLATSDIETALAFCGLSDRAPDAPALLQVG